MKPLIVFFDGPCVLCNWWVMKLCKWDQKDQLRFAPLQDSVFNEFAAERNLDASKRDSLVVWDQTYSYGFEADAIFMILNRLGGAWNVFLMFSFLPKFITNGLYRMVAKNRYRWFGKHKNCPLPHPKYSHKFI